MLPRQLSGKRTRKSNHPFQKAPDNQILAWRPLSQHRFYHLIVLMKLRRLQEYCSQTALEERQPLVSFLFHLLKLFFCKISLLDSCKHFDGFSGQPKPDHLKLPHTSSYIAGLPGHFQRESSYLHFAHRFFQCPLASHRLLFCLSLKPFSQTLSREDYYNFLTSAVLQRPTGPFLPRHSRQAPQLLAFFSGKGCLAKTRYAFAFLRCLLCHYLTGRLHLSHSWTIRNHPALPLRFRRSC